MLDDNGIPHSATATQNHIEALSFECLHNPQYSPDLSLSDFHLFLALKNLGRWHFRSNAKIKQAVKRFFPMQSPYFFL